MCSGSLSPRLRTALDAALQVPLGAAHVGDGVFEFLDAIAEPAGSRVGSQEAGGELLDGRLDFLFEDLQEMLALVLGVDRGLMEVREDRAMDVRIDFALGIDIHSLDRRLRGSACSDSGGAMASSACARPCTALSHLGRSWRTCL